MENTIAVLDSTTGILTVMKIPENITESESIEEFLSEEGFSLSNIDWMELKGIDINI